MSNGEIKDFNYGNVDFGKQPATSVLTDEQKKTVALAMAINAALVQFINEGLIDLGQQLHFMGHVQDFVQRIYQGEGIKLPNTKQTLQINSKAGTLFHEATEVSFTKGVENFQKIRELYAEAIAEQSTEVQDNDASVKRVLH